MKKLIKKLSLILSISLLITSCTKPAATSGKKIIIGATLEPHVQILNQVVPDLKEKGIDLEVKEFTDWPLLNTAVEQKELDANFFQHDPYFLNDIAKTKAKLVSIGVVHIEPLGIYSKKITSLDDIKDGAEIAVPDDATNQGRALLLLQDKGIIELDPASGLEATKDSITKNPKNIKILPQEASIIPLSLEDVDLAVINGNYALNAGLNPSKDAIAVENSVNNPYANIIVVREEDKDRPEFAELMNALHSDKVKDFINKTYNGAVIPASSTK